MNTKTNTPFITSGFKKLKVILLSVIFIALTFSVKQVLSSKVSAPDHTKTNGIIVMSDDIMIVDTEDDHRTVVHAAVWSGSTLVFQQQGCGSTRCNYNLSALSSGSYYAIADEDDGGKITGYILVP